MHQAQLSSLTLHHKAQKSLRQSISDSQNGGQRSECAQIAGVWPQSVSPDRELLGFARLINGKSNC